MVKEYFNNYCIKNSKDIPKMEVVDANTPLLDYSRKNVKLDICVNNILGCVNSLMLKTLSEIHPLIPKLGVVIKAWAK